MATKTGLDQYAIDTLYAKGQEDRKHNTGELMPEELYRYTPKEQAIRYDVWLAGYRGDPKPTGGQ